MTNTLQNKKNTKEHRPNNTKEHSNWGAKLFLGTLFAVLAFFWWLLIYSGGVGGHHG
jgi:hypothetical protein